MSMDDEWGRPTEVTGEYARPSDLKGHLLIVYPLGYVAEIQTKFGISDGMSVDVIDLDDKDEHGQPGKVYRNSNFMQAQLIASLKSQVGTKILGVMSQGVSKTGMNPPWVIVDMSGDPTARERASAWKQAHPNFRPSPFAPRDLQASAPQAQQQRPQQPQYPQQRPQQPPPQEPVRNYTLESMSTPPYQGVAGSTTLSNEEQDLLQQFRAQRNRASQQGPYDDDPAPF